MDRSPDDIINDYLNGVINPIFYREDLLVRRLEERKGNNLLPIFSTKHKIGINGFLKQQDSLLNYCKRYEMDHLFLMILENMIKNGGNIENAVILWYNKQQPKSYKIKKLLKCKV